MSRTVSALVTWDDTYLGTIGPVAVGVPWWVEVEPVVACLHEALGVPVFVLRLLTVEGGDVHGDFHPGNWRSDGGPPVVLDWADAHLGNPTLDGLRARDFLPESKRPIAVRAWIRAWTARRPGCDPARALSVAEPLAHLAYAVRYQEFLDGIEPSERIYHQGDAAASIRAALKAR